MWKLKSEVSSYSVRNSDDIKATFAAVFPDNNIVKMKTLNRTKSMYAIYHGLAPFFKSALLSDIHPYPFDESVNEVRETCEMDLF